MKSGGYKNDSFANRLASSADAKNALLERFRARPMITFFTEPNQLFIIANFLFQPQRCG